MDTENIGSRDVARSAILIALTRTREEETNMRAAFSAQGILSAAVDYGGDFVQSVSKIVERAVVAAKREKIIGETHHEEGAVAGAAREAVAQVMNKALGLSVGGKIGVARSGDHIAVAVFFGVGLLHLNEVCVGMGHRAI
ncbi:MAG: HutP family protein [Eubacteriales bacterium]|nr:HutP family protein [Eubacteriales bacterium]MDD3883049.1 HutP family protein [Eubacteriales bacterium]MDD4513600.1 HutP family protein [Eubacteriales bacterium]